MPFNLFKKRSTKSVAAMRYHDVVPNVVPIRTQRKSPRILMGVGAGVLIPVLLFTTLFNTQLFADTVSLYPSTCLGGWQNPEHAQGDLTPPRTLLSYTPEEAAVLTSNTIAELYCGGFKADIPPSSTPTSLTLSLAWSTNKAEAAPVVTGNTFASSTGAILDAPAGSNPTFTAPPTLIAPSEDTTPSATPTTLPIPDTTETVPVAPVVPVVPEPASSPPAAEPPPVPEAPVSFLQFLTTTAHAEESTALPAAAMLSTSPASTTLATEPVNKSAATIGDPEFIEVRYTFDGKIWLSLGSFDAAHIVPMTFSIPVPPQATWNDLTSFQVSVRSSASFDATPPVYVDGMELRVGYGAVSASRFFADKNEYATNDVITITSSEARSAVSVYWINNPASTTDPYNPFAAIIGDDGTVKLETTMFQEGKYVLLNTNDPDHCGDISLDACRVRDGYLGESFIAIGDSYVAAAAQAAEEAKAAAAQAAADAAAKAAASIVLPETLPVPQPTVVPAVENTPPPPFDGVL